MALPTLSATTDGLTIDGQSVEEEAALNAGTSQQSLSADEPGDIILRPYGYQLEMLEESLKVGQSEFFATTTPKNLTVELEKYRRCCTLKNTDGEFEPLTRS